MRIGKKREDRERGEVEGSRGERGETEQSKGKKRFRGKRWREKWQREGD